jgi:multisubunit Na+/H+ antiporter MnhF subunit
MVMLLLLLAGYAFTTATLLVLLMLLVTVQRIVRGPSSPSRTGRSHPPACDQPDCVLAA